MKTEDNVTYPKKYDILSDEITYIYNIHDVVKIMSFTQALFILTDIHMCIRIKY